MYKTISTLLFSCLISFNLAAAPIANIEDNSADTLVFPLMRTTFIEGATSVSYKLKNATSNIPYLIQANMETLDERSGISLLEKDNKIPFMITPPLNKLEPGQTYIWRVMFIGNAENLPKDKESIYIAKFRAIPPSVAADDEKADNTNLTTIQVINFKTYYRPKQFEQLTIEDEQKKISFKQSGNELIVYNHSPIYMTFENLSVNGIEIDENELFKPLIPLGEQHFTLKGTAKAGDTVTWTMLDELVLPLKTQTSILQ